MEAGRELDAQVAERVMGYLVEREYWRYSDPTPQNSADWRRIPYYSTDIAAAWQVVERLHELHRNDTSVIYCLSLTKWNEMYYCGFTELKDDVVEASKAPLAICFAALKALESNLSRQPR